MESIKMETIINEFTERCRLLLGNKLAEVYLFGSYARGDYNEESDIDVMLLLNLDKTETMNYLNAVCQIASEIDLKYGVFLSPVLQSKMFFETNKSASGFYRNVKREGVGYYAQ